LREYKLIGGKWVIAVFWASGRKLIYTL